MADEPRLWWCRPATAGERHVLGQVARNADGITELLLYRMAIDPQADCPASVDVIGSLMGQISDVRCSICGTIRTWVPGQDELDHLVEGIKRRRRG